MSNRELDSHILPALNWVAIQLKYAVVTENNIILTAGIREFPIPKDLGWVVFVEWNTQRLQPSSTYRWDREGTDWRNAAPGNPTEFALVVGGRNITLFPPPSSAAIAIDPSITIRYISSAPKLESDGTPQLGDLDQELVLYRAAIRYLRAHPNDVNMARVQGYLDEIADILPAAKRRAENPIEDFFPHFHVHSSRMRGAR